MRRVAAARELRRVHIILQRPCVGENSCIEPNNDRHIRPTHRHTEQNVVIIPRNGNNSVRNVVKRISQIANAVGKNGITIRNSSQERNIRSVGDAD